MISGVSPSGLGVERRVALGLRAQRVEARGQVPVRAVGLDERRRRLHGLQQRSSTSPARPETSGRATGSRATAAAAAGAGGGGAGPSSAPSDAKTPS